MNILKFTAIALLIISAAPTFANEVYNLSSGVSITAPTNMEWKKYELEENEVSLTNQTDTPPYHTSFLTLRISTVDSGANSIEQIIEHSGKRLSRFSINENNSELLISLNYKRESFLGMDCISNKWETVYPHQKTEGTHTTFRVVQMMECPIPESRNQIASLSFAYSGKENNIPLEMQEDAEAFFESLTLDAASKK